MEPRDTRTASDTDDAIRQHHRRDQRRQPPDTPPAWKTAEAARVEATSVNPPVEAIDGESAAARRRPPVASRAHHVEVKLFPAAVSAPQRIATFDPILLKTEIVVFADPCKLIAMLLFDHSSKCRSWRMAAARNCGPRK